MRGGGSDNNVRRKEESRVGQYDRHKYFDREGGACFGRVQTTVLRKSLRLLPCSRSRYGFSPTKTARSPERSHVGS